METRARLVKGEGPTAPLPTVAEIRYDGQAPHLAKLWGITGLNIGGPVPYAKRKYPDGRQGTGRYTSAKGADSCSVCLVAGGH